jgi:hypothetical protein
VPKFRLEPLNGRIAPMTLVRSSGAAPPMRTIRRPTFPVRNGVGSGLPEETKQRLPTTPRERLVEVGARIVRRGPSIMFQMAEVMVVCEQFLARPSSCRQTLAAGARRGFDRRWDHTVYVLSRHQPRTSQTTRP